MEIIKIIQKQRENQRSKNWNMKNQYTNNERERNSSILFRKPWKQVKISRDFTKSKKSKIKNYELENKSK